MLRKFVLLVVIVMFAVSGCGSAPEAEEKLAAVQEQHQEQWQEVLEWVENLINTEQTFRYTPIQDPHVLLIKVESNGTSLVNPEWVQLELAHRLVDFFESKPVIPDLDIESSSWDQPSEHYILFINQGTGLPEGINVEVGEQTYTVIQDDGNVHITIINFAGTQKRWGPEFTNAWSLAQGFCLGYLNSDVNSDPKCNIIAANVAFMWAYEGSLTGEQFFEQELSGYTSLEGFTATKDYRYQYLEAVKDFFGD
jgi:hypothetical protein